MPGESLENVAYKLLEPENIQNKNVIVVGGGDSAIEAALSLMDNNRVLLSYRSEAFARLKPKNKEKVEAAAREEKLKVLFKSNLTQIEPDRVWMRMDGETDPKPLENDLVFIFAGGELPTQFLEKAGVRITKRFGYTVKKYK